jgi:hypothetical protein
VASAIVLVAMVTTIVSHKNSAKVVTAVGNAFAGGIRAAMGH